MATGHMNLSKLAKQFSDEDAARAFMEELRWGKNAENAACPHCGTVDPYRLTPKPGSTTRKGVWKCRAGQCRKQFTVTVGTVFESSHIPLSKWLLAIHLLASSKKGISAHQLHRNLGITYEAAWFMAHRLRYAMMQGPLFDLLKGDVEIDETYVGARKKRGTKRGRPGPDSHKTPVVALIERKTGRVRAMPMPRITAENLKAAVKKHVSPDARMITDELTAYKSVSAETQNPHEFVHHGSGQYVRGDVHVNTAEGFFSLLKRGINGVYHHVGRGHLGRYVDEFSFRYEHRQTTDGQRAALIVLGGDGKRLMYRD